MANKVINESVRSKALEYRTLNIEKYKQLVAELETRLEVLKAMTASKAQKREIQICTESLAQAKTDYKNVLKLSEEIFVKVVSERGLMLNVVNNFDSGKIERRESHVLSPEKAEEIVAQREARKSLYKKMSLEELLDVAMSNEQLEIEILKTKIALNQKGLSEQGSEPSSR